MKRLSPFVILSLLASLISPATAADTSTLPRVTKESLTYVGAFRLPDGTFGKSNFNYGGTAIAFNPNRNSLFMAGHDWDQMVAEINIPELKKADHADDLEVAKVLQPFADPTDGKMYNVDVDTVKVGGLLVYGDKLIESAYSYYDGDANQSLSHIVTTLDTGKKDDAKGPYQVGDVGAGFVSGYMAPVPAEWQVAFGGPALTGQCCIAIISRSSYGPAVSVFNPSDLGTKSVTPATPLVYYTDQHTTLGAWDGHSTQFNGNTQIRGMVFPSGTRSILFVGSQGLGKFCYGTGAECKDPASDSKGVHGYPYAYQIWAYDANELLAVKNKEKNPWDIKPYAVWNFDLPYISSDDNHEIGGAAYDSATGRLFISQKYGNGTLPVVHVFQIAGVALAPAPTPVPTPAPTPLPAQDVPDASQTASPTPITTEPTPTASPVVPLPPDTATACTGLTGRYYKKQNFSKLAFTRVDPFIHFHWDDQSPDERIPDDRFSIRWSGFVTPKYTEQYTFSSVSDDGVRLWINGRLIINQWKHQRPTEARGTVKLQAGKPYTLVFEYYENTGHAEAELLWSSPSQAKETIPTFSLTPNRACLK